MVYAAIYGMGGIIGVIIFALPFIHIIKKFLHYKNNNIVKGTLIGISLYLIIAIVEGALWLPPTGLNLWVIASIGNIAVRLENRKNITNLNLNKTS